MLDETKVFYNPGDLIKCKHFEDAPVMYVVEKSTRSMTKTNGEKETIFLGIKCRWFDNNKVLREAIFSTKDLKHV